MKNNSILANFQEKLKIVKFALLFDRYVITHTGWPRSPDTNVQAYCCFVESFVNLIFYGKCYMHQPFEDFTKIKKKWVHFLFIFVHFRLFWALLV